MPANAATEDDIRKWCTNYLGQLIDLAPEQIDPNAKFTRLGLDSANAVQLIMMLEDRLGIELDPEIVSECPTVALLAHHLVLEARKKAGP